MATPRLTSLLPLVALTAPLVAAVAPPTGHAQPRDDNPFGGDLSRGRDGLEDRTGYGDASYGGAAYGGAAYGGAAYGGAAYGGAAAGIGDAPAVLAQTWTAVERIDDRGRRVLHDMPMVGPIAAHDYQPVLADEASGRWFMARQRRVDGGVAPAWTIVMGDRDGVIAERAGDPTCTGRPTCFEQPLALTARGDALMTLSLSRRGTTLGSYADATRPRRALAGRSIATRLALAPAQDRAAYVTRGGVTFIDWAGDGPSRRPHPVRVKVPGNLDSLALTATTLFYTREVPGKVTVEAIDVATRQRRLAYDPGTLMVPWAPLAAPARGTVFTHACRSSYEQNPCDLIELSARGARVAIRGIAVAFDISADGRYALVRRSPADRRGRTTAWDDLVVYDLVTGADVRVVPEIELLGAQFTR